MKANQFFAPSLTLANGATIETNDDFIAVTDAEGGAFEYRNGGQFADADAAFLSYENLIAILSREDWTEDEISARMADSLERSARHFAGS